MTARALVRRLPPAIADAGYCHRPDLSMRSNGVCTRCVQRLHDIRASRDPASPSPSMRHILGLHHRNLIEGVCHARDWSSERPEDGR